MNLVEIYGMQSNVLIISCQAAASSSALCCSWLPGDVQLRESPPQASVDTLCASQTETQLPPRWAQSQEPPGILFSGTVSVIWCYLSSIDTLYLTLQWQWCFTPQLASRSSISAVLGCDHSSTENTQSSLNSLLKEIFYTGVLMILSHLSCWPHNLIQNFL